MKLKDAIDWIKEEKNKLKEFAIKFIKKDNSIREMKCKYGVKDDLVNNPYNSGLNFEKHHLIAVMDLDKSEYRSFHPDKLTAIKIEDGPWQIIEDAKHIPTLS